MLRAVVLACLCYALGAGPAEAKKKSEARNVRLLEGIGAPKIPPYVRLGELEDLQRVVFMVATDLQVRRPDGERIVLDRKVRYLWAVIEDGAVLIAPDARLPNGERVGHVNLSLGRKVRLAGDLTWSKRNQHWLLDPNSRFGHKQNATRAQLKAARRWIEKIGIESDGEKAKLKTRHISPPDQPEAGALERQLRAGGFVLVPDKGATAEALPEGHRTLKQRMSWARRAQRLHNPRAKIRR